MSVVLVMLTIDSLAVISPGGANVPPYTVINQHIDYKFDESRGHDMPVIGGPEPLFGKIVDAATASALIDKGKMVIQSRACIDCHTFFGNGAYYARTSPRLGSIPIGRRGRPSPAPTRARGRW
jgi:nitric oxide reductase subunit C